MMKPGESPVLNRCALAFTLSHASRDATLLLPDLLTIF
ncbi:hypothetical protein DAQ1742_04101 [Dickeya aquatica]|uniref:Uncharacterized protein n=1 Tax=Dickeya aquatica TaxID=1401087 RepID=A0A375AFI8_9GAMM|nr:hypothetical protein DAQ1742_04101 [Dickeya aquatica]